MGQAQIVEQVKSAQGASGQLQLRLSGNWKGAQSSEGKQAARNAIQQTSALKTLQLNGQEISDWDSSLIAWLFALSRLCKAQSSTLELRDFPKGVQELLNLATAIPERAGARREATKESWLSAVGRSYLSFSKAIKDSLSFLGEACVALVRLFTRKARVPFSDVWLTMEQCGPSALPIVTLISGLVGLILAFIGAQQLARFGAEIYVANLVGIAMVREMGGIMAGVIMAGRTGAAFAAQLGSMQVNEEVDALTTFGFSPMEYLVLPRMLALIFMLPLLCLYANLVGILGGGLVAATVLDISFIKYLTQMQEGLKLTDLWVGLIKSVIFGVLVALAGCMRGLQCGRSASAVGTAVTSAVVFGIVAIVVADAIFAVVCQVIGV
jgi:phospholipid/cholesterol/gamma-HCH transport system permease protein